MSPSAPLLFALLLLVTPPLHAQGDLCALLKPSEASALLGGSAVATAASTGGGCVWKVATGPKKLLLTRMRATGTAAEMNFAGARQAAQKEGERSAADQPGLGDKAFSVLASFGVSVIVLKGGRLLQMQYWSGAQGTPADLAAFLPIAKKAAAAF